MLNRSAKIIALLRSSTQGLSLHTLSLLFMGFFPILVFGCSEEPSPAPDPVILSFEANPTQLVSGDSVTLSWTTRNSVRVVILEEGDPNDILISIIDNQEQVDSGAFELQPIQNISYFLVASNGEEKEDRKEVSVSVEE